MEQSPDRIASKYPILESFLKIILTETKRLKEEKTTSRISSEEIRQMVTDEKLNFYLCNIVYEAREIPEAERETKNIPYAEEAKNKFIDLVTYILEKEKKSGTPLSEIAETLMEYFKPLLGRKTEPSENVILDPIIQEKFKKRAQETLQESTYFAKLSVEKVEPNLNKHFLRVPRN